MYLEIHFLGGILCRVLQNMIDSVIYSNNVMRSHRHCCYGQSTMQYLSALELHVTVNSTKALNVAMGTQEWIYFALLPSCELLRTAATDITSTPVFM